MCKPLALMTTFNMWLQRLLVSTLKVESSCVPFCFPFVLSWSRHKHKDNSMSPMQIKYSVLYSSPQYILFGHTHLHCTSYSNIFYFLEQSSHMKSCLDRASSWIHTSANKQGLIEKYCHVAIGHWLVSESSSTTDKFQSFNGYISDHQAAVKSIWAHCRYLFYCYPRGHQ